MELLRRLRIQTRIWLQVIIAFVGLAILMTVMLGQLHDSLRSIKSQNTEHLVETVNSMLASFHDREVSGELSREEAQRQALAVINEIRYGDNNYIWVQDHEPKMILHPVNPSLNGKDLSNIKDPNGKRLFQEAADLVRRDKEGVIFYMWPLPGEKEPVEKVSYVKAFAPWGWIVGSGVYMVDVEQAFRSALQLPLLISFLVAIFVGLLALLLGTSITRPLQQMAAAMNDIASGEGDLTRRLQVNPADRDELALVASSFNAFIVKIENIIVQVKAATTGLTQASSHLRQVATANAKSLDTQLHESHAIATAVTEMASAATEIARNSEGAAASASKANEEAAGGKLIVSKALQSVNALAGEINNASRIINVVNDSSQAISSVLDVIRSIAEQTNLLALNAAIEAARAGDQGRGFAVVADEVRTLAARTQSSTEEIRNMIDSLQNGSGQAVQAMKSGEQTAVATVSQANVAGDSLENIVRAIHSITEMNMQIASAAEEQSAVAHEIDEGINRVSQLITSSASEVERTSQFTQKLEDLSNSLAVLVTQFKVADK